MRGLTCTSLAYLKPTYANSRPLRCSGIPHLKEKQACNSNYMALDNKYKNGIGPCTQPGTNAAGGEEMVYCFEKGIVELEQKNPAYSR
jgi:hypothetical protein